MILYVVIKSRCNGVTRYSKSLLSVCVCESSLTTLFKVVEPKRLVFTKLPNFVNSSSLRDFRLQISVSLIFLKVMMPCLLRVRARLLSWLQNHCKVSKYDRLSYRFLALNF